VTLLHRVRYTLEFKLEAVRPVKAGQEASLTARVLGMPKQTLSNWARLAEKGELQGAGDRPVNAEQDEMARLRAELARAKMEHDILKKCDRVLREGIAVKYAWIGKNKAAWPVTVTCEVLGLSNQRLLRASAPAPHEPTQPAWRWSAQQRGPAVPHSSNPRRGQRRIRLAKGMEGAAGARHSRRQGPRAATDAHALHQGAQQEEVRRHHRQQE
jgi:transposase-like protein